MRRWFAGQRQDHVVFGDVVDARLMVAVAVSANSFGNHYVGRQRNMGDSHEALGFVDQVALDQRFADRFTCSRKESVGNTAAHDQLVDDFGQGFQHGQLW